MSSASYDVVVGAGDAALCAHEAGAKVLLLEKAPEREKGGNGSFAGGGFRLMRSGLDHVRRVPGA